MEQQRIKEEQDLRIRQAQQRAQEAAKQEQLILAAKQAEEAKLQAALALERQRIRDAEARRIAAELAEQRRIQEAEEEKARVRLAEMQRQQALQLVEGLESQWPSLDAESKAAQARSIAVGLQSCPCLFMLTTGSSLTALHCQFCHNAKPHPSTRN